MKKFKGIILGMIFVFGMSFTADAKAAVKVEYDNCFNSSINMTEALDALYNYSDVEFAEALNNVYAWCMSQQP